MATHPSILAWEIPRTEKSGELQSMGSQRVGHNCAKTEHAYTLFFFFFFFFSFVCSEILNKDDILHIEGLSLHLPD